MVHGSWSVPPTRILDRLFPGVDVGAGCLVGGGSFGRAPAAMSSRILARRSNSIMTTGSMAPSAHPPTGKAQSAHLARHDREEANGTALRGHRTPRKRRRDPKP